MNPCCANCKWWTRHTNELRDYLGTCAVPLPPAATVTPYHLRPTAPSGADYYCVLHKPEEGT